MLLSGLPGNTCYVSELEAQQCGEDDLEAAVTQTPGLKHTFFSLGDVACQ